MLMKVKTTRSRLISLAYEVLNRMEPPPEGASELDTLLLLSEAFLAVAAREADPLKEWEGTFMFSKLGDIRHLRNLH